MSIKNVSFVGLGVMGYPMAGHLKKNNNLIVGNSKEFNLQILNKLGV